jgi:hypothetical protein
MREKRKSYFRVNVKNKAPRDTKNENLPLSDDVIDHYDPNKTLTWNCDASPYGIRAVLSQKSSDVEHSVGFVSHTL